MCICLVIFSFAESFCYDYTSSTKLTSQHLVVVDIHGGQSPNNEFHSCSSRLIGRLHCYTCGHWLSIGAHIKIDFCQNGHAFYAFGEVAYMGHLQLKQKLHVWAAKWHGAELG